MEYTLRRKLDSFLVDWKANPDHLPLIIKGARQVGKTSSITHFAKNYKSFISINFIEEPKYKRIFEKGFKPDTVIREISF